MIKERKNPISWAKLSCHARVDSSEVEECFGMLTKGPTPAARMARGSSERRQRNK